MKTAKVQIPDGFLKLFKEALDSQDVSLREIGRRSRISVSYIVRILKGERGLPDDAKLLDLAKALGIQPPEKLLVEAGRVPKGQQKILLRTVSNLSEAELERVLKFARNIQKKKP